MVIVQLSEDQTLKLAIISQAADVVASYPDFWDDGDVNDLPFDHLKIATLRLRAKDELARSGCELGLAGRAWFAYRRCDAMERTMIFVRQHDLILQRFMTLNPNLSLSGRKLFKDRGRYLSQAQLNHPWCRQTTTKGVSRWVKSPMWKAYVDARRRADQFTIPYDEFIEAGLVAIAARGWQHANANCPSHLASAKIFGGQDNYTDATIAGILLKRYAETPRRCMDSHFLKPAWVGDQLQRAHLRFFARELVRIYGAMAEGKWRLYLKADELPAVPFHEALAFDDRVAHLS